MFSAHFIITKRGRCTQHPDPLAGQNRRVDGEAYGHEEEAEKQAAKCLDLRLDEQSVTRIGQRHTAQKRAQRQRKAGQPGQPPGGKCDEQGGRGKHFTAVNAGNDAEQRFGKITRKHRRNGKSSQCFECGNPQRSAQRLPTAQTACHHQQRNRGNILKNQDGLRGAAHRAIFLIAFAHDADDHRGGRQRHGEPAQDRRQRRQSERQAQCGKTTTGNQHLQRAETEDVARFFPYSCKGKMQAQIEQQEHHARFRQCRHDRTVERLRLTRKAQDHTQYDIAHDRVQPQHLCSKRGQDTQAQKNDGGADRIGDHMAACGKQFEHDRVSASNGAPMPLPYM